MPGTSVSSATAAAYATLVIGPPPKIESRCGSCDKEYELGKDPYPVHPVFGVLLAAHLGDVRRLPEGGRPRSRVVGGEARRVGACRTAGRLGPRRAIGA